MRAAGRATWVAGTMAALTATAALAGSPTGHFVMPPPDAPASAYGVGMRSSHGHVNADDLAGLAERLREQGNLTAALELSLRVRAFAPDNVQAIQTEVSTLSNLTQAHRAYALAMQNAALFKSEDLQRLRADRTADDIRQALATRDRLEQRFLYADRNQPLKTVLAQLDADLASFPRGSPAYLRTQGNRVQVLQALGRHQAAVDAWHDLQLFPAPVPRHVLRAAAGAENSLHHPLAAARLYRGIVRADPGSDVEIFIELYYALIDGEDYAAAGTVLNDIHRVTPVWIYPAGARAERQPNWERIDVDQTWAMDAAYRQQPATAQARAKNLADRAPSNAGLLNTYATMLRWRGWPQASRRITDRAAAYAPLAMETRLNVADNARDAGDVALWRQTIVPLAALFPDNAQIVESNAELGDRDHASISSDFTTGRSRGGNQIQGNRDRQLLTQVNSPWSADGWRAFAGQDYRWSDYPEGSGSYNRVGIGAERRWDRKDLTAQLSNDRLSGRHVGLQLGWSQWLGDHWYYQAKADTYSTQTPLRAERAGLRGRLLDTQVTWRASESRSAYLDANVLDISDGNRRVSLSAGFTQRVQASSHHLTDLSLILDNTHNSRPGGDYFNPSSQRSQGLQLEHQWITWRRYQQSLTQSFIVSGSSDWESKHGSRAGFGVQYGNSWQLSRTWSLNYGVGWGSHVYDGSREHRVFGTVGFSGVF
ncbi:hypothetical protein [Rhodanobacter ginsengiterrae]|uniref:hypothetical protein n=1 Tax=Rhodanobacter ginsengiterrae TaxID=2008451 RepID=UPI003CF31B7F